MLKNICLPYETFQAWIDQDEFQCTVLQALDAQSAPRKMHNEGRGAVQGSATALVQRRAPVQAWECRALHHIDPLLFFLLFMITCASSLPELTFLRVCHF